VTISSYKSVYSTKLPRSKRSCLRMCCFSLNEFAVKERQLLRQGYLACSRIQVLQVRVWTHSSSHICSRIISWERYESHLKSGTFDASVHNGFWDKVSKMLLVQARIQVIPAELHPTRFMCVFRSSILCSVSIPPSLLSNGYRGFSL
jgi:hypothetical protein